MCAPECETQNIVLVQFSEISVVLCIKLNLVLELLVILVINKDTIFHDSIPIGLESTTYVHHY